MRRSRWGSTPHTAQSKEAVGVGPFPPEALPNAPMLQQGLPTAQPVGTAFCNDQTKSALKRTSLQAPLKRMVRRDQLKQMVPLGDTTIYEMEQRGEFPRRCYLTARCVAWDLAEIESWIEERRRASAAHLIKQAPSPDVRKRASRPVRR